MTDAQARDLLIELGCEELPPKALAPLAEVFFDGCCDGLEAAGIAFDRQRSRYFFTPRRMAMLPVRSCRSAAGSHPGATRAGSISGLRPERRAHACCTGLCPFRRQGRVRTGTPSKRQGRVAGQPAAYSRPDAWRSPVPLVATGPRWPAGAQTDALVRSQLQLCTTGALAGGIAWRAGTRRQPVRAPGRARNACASHTRPRSALTFRPWRLPRSTARWPCRSRSARTPRPHCRSWRASRASRPVDIPASHAGLLDEVTNLVEWPVAVTCHFDPEFLEVPAEALIASMEGHQKFFPVLSAAESERTSQLTAAFVVIANIESTRRFADDRRF